MKSSNIAFLLAAASLVACSTSSDDKADIETVKSSLARDTTPVLSPSELDTFATDRADFAVELYRAVAKDPANATKDIFLSPHSVSSALAMTYAGARGQTKSEMTKALHFEANDDVVNRGFDFVDLRLQAAGNAGQGKDGGPARLEIANAIWGQKGLQLETPFLDTLAVSYGAGVAVADFATDPEGSTNRINGWVADKTEGRITNLLPTLARSTRLVLVNAVYFNAAWATSFNASTTAPAPFTKLDSSVTQVAMMHQRLNATYMHGDDFDAVELPYGGELTSMLVIAPTKGSFETYESALTGARILDVLGGLRGKDVILSFPKTKLSAGFELSKPLESLGMKSAFGGADFSGVTESEPLSISAVVHRTFLAVDEQGTEAAAATGVDEVETSAEVPLPTVTMTVDRPYIIAIVDRSTKTILFLGRILEPKG
jgi:serpin B